MSYYVHNVPGRLRIKIPAVRRNPLAARAVLELLERIDGVTSCTLNELTGSLVIYYNPSEAGGDQILAQLSNRGYFDPSKALNSDQYIRKAASRAGQAISKAVFGFAVDRAFEGTGLSFISALI